MVKTQVQIPNDLYRDTKAIAEQYEMSFAEVVRRGLERMRYAYPPRRGTGPWQPPQPQFRGAAEVTAEELRDIARASTAAASLLKARTK